jgi:hypothetical protein
VKLVYKPFGLIASVLAGLVAGAVFKRIWSAVADEEEAPNAKDQDRTWHEVVTAAAIEGAVFGAVKALVDRAGASGFARVTGVWPGDTESKRPDA